jgi:hypothetical protein
MAFSHLNRKQLPNKMTTSDTVSVQNLTTSKVQSKSKPRQRWSGDEEPIEYHRGYDDEDTVTLTADEIRRLNWYAAQAHKEWRDADVDITVALPTAAAAPVKTSPRVPFRHLTGAERNKKSDLFQFGLCSDCDTGLGDKSDFVCVPRPNGAFLMTCHACHEYYQQLKKCS